MWIMTVVLELSIHKNFHLNSGLAFLTVLRRMSMASRCTKPNEHGIITQVNRSCVRGLRPFPRSCFLAAPRTKHRTGEGNRQRENKKKMHQIKRKVRVGKFGSTYYCRLGGLIVSSHSRNSLELQIVTLVILVKALCWSSNIYF